MSFYIISYDLVKSKDYKKIEEGISQLNAVKIHMSVWLVSSYKSSQELYDFIKSYVDADDRLMVIRTPLDSYNIRSINKPSLDNWLSRNKY